MEKLLNKIESFLSKSHINLFKTLYVNLRLLPLKDALKLPIYIYGKCNICNLSGSVKIVGKISRGMIKLGLRQGFFTAPTMGGMLYIQEDGEITFDGPCAFDYNYVIRITNNGKLKIGKNVVFGNDVKICCENSIRIGDFCRIAYCSTFMDTNFHYTINTNNGIIYRKEGSIVVENYNWIGNTSTLMKGTKIPTGCIIASKSYLNKDFIKISEGKNCLIIGGAPAAIIKDHNTRIFSFDIEYKLNKWFKDNPNCNKYENTDFFKQLLELHSYMQ